MSELEDARKDDAAAASDEARMIANGLLLDALVTYVAVLMDRGLTNRVTGASLIEAWGTACEDMCHHAERISAPVIPPDNTQRAALLRALGVSSVDSIDDEQIEVLIEERRALIREVEVEEEHEA